MTEQTPARPALFSRPAPILFFIIVAVFLDQIVKIAVDHYLPLQEAVPVIPMLALYRTYNLGVAFSMLEGMTSTLAGPERRQKGYCSITLRFNATSAAISPSYSKSTRRLSRIFTASRTRSERSPEGWPKVE